jgi:hypothetical protein
MRKPPIVPIAYPNLYPGRDLDLLILVSQTTHAPAMAPDD